MYETPTPERRYNPLLEPTPRMLYQFEELYPSVNVRLLGLIQTVRYFHRLVPEDQMTRVDLAFKLPVSTEPQEEIDNLEYEISLAVLKMKELIAQKTDVEYWRFILAEEILIFTAQDELIRRGISPCVGGNNGDSDHNRRWIIVCGIEDYPRPWWWDQVYDKPWLGKN